jgi:hypothetical protein
VSAERRLACWRVRDSGLVPAPPRFRRLGGLTRHHRGHGEPWPDQVELVVTEDWLEVPGVGRWPIDEVGADVVAAGPPLTFVVRVPGSSQLLAASVGRDADAVLGALGALDAGGGRDDRS